MAAAYQDPWQLASANMPHGQHRRGAGGNAPQLPTTDHFGVMAAATSRRAAEESSAAMRVGAEVASAGLREQGNFSTQAFGALARLSGESMAAATNAFAAKTTADAAVKRAKIENQDSPMDMIRMAGGGLLTLYALSQDDTA